MVNVEPFIFQKVTAFKERLQMVDKINEIVDTINTSVIGPDEIRQIVENELTDYYDKAEIDQMFSTIDFSPYYTKTEVNAIISRVDGDVDAVEGRLDTAEDDIDALETNKQDVLTAGTNIDITNNVISLSEWEPVPLSEWASLFTVNGKEYTANDTFVIELFGRGQDSKNVGYLNTSLLFLKGKGYYQHVSLPAIPYTVYAQRTGLYVPTLNLALIKGDDTRMFIYSYNYYLTGYSMPDKPYYTMHFGENTISYPDPYKKDTSIDFSSTTGIQLIIYRRK